MAEVTRAIRPSVCVAALAAAALVAAACQALPAGAQCRSLVDGRPLFPPEIEPQRRTELETDLALAEAARAAAPDDPLATIWVGRRLGYLGRHREAIEVYSQGLDFRPGDAGLLRHRGHRWITLREFGRATLDLERAAAACRTTPDAVEPDGQPVAGRPPHSTLHYNVHYHLGLAWFLHGDAAAAERAWLDCLAVVRNDESRVAVTHWLWCARMQQGDTAGAAAVVAAIRPEMDVVENRGYWQLCLLYAGLLRREDVEAREGSAGAAVAFGLAHRDLVLGERATARRRLEALAKSPQWGAFGVIAAEATLARLGR